MRRPGSEDPYWREWNFFFFFPQDKHFKGYIQWHLMKMTYHKIQPKNYKKLKISATTQILQILSEFKLQPLCKNLICLVYHSFKTICTDKWTFNKLTFM